MKLMMNYPKLQKTKIKMASKYFTGLTGSSVPKLISSFFLAPIFRPFLMKYGTDSTSYSVRGVLFFSWASDWFSLPELAEFLAIRGLSLVRPK